MSTAPMIKAAVNLLYADSVPVAAVIRDGASGIQCLYSLERMDADEIAELFNKNSLWQPLKETRSSGSASPQKT